jgi:hypothetical protein
MKGSRLILNLALVVIAVAAVVALQAAPGGGGSGCEGDVKNDFGGPGSFVAPAGTGIASVCIKAGRGVFTFECNDPGDGCYSLSWTYDAALGCCTAVSYGGGGTGPTCKSISHGAASFGAPCEPEPTPEPSPDPPDPSPLP